MEPHLICFPAAKIPFELPPRPVSEGRAGGCREGGRAALPGSPLRGVGGPAVGDIPGGEVPPLASLPGRNNPKQELHFSLFQQLFLQHCDLWCLGQGDGSHPGALPGTENGANSGAGSCFCGSRL